MPSRGLLVLAVVTVTVVGLTSIAVDRRYRDAALARQEGGRVFPQFRHQASDVAEIEVTRASGRFTLARRGDQWNNMGIGGFPATAARVEAMLGDIAAMRYIEPKTGRPGLYHKLDVGDVAPGTRSTRLAVKNRHGAVLADIIVGKTKARGAGHGGPGAYVRIPGDPRTWLASGSLDVRHDAVGWSDSAVVSIEPDSVMALTVTHADGEVVALHRRQPDDRKLTLKNPPPGTRVEHQHQIDYMAGLLHELRFSDSRRTAPRVGSVAAVEATVRSRDHLAITLHVEEMSDDGSVWARVRAHLTDETRASNHVKLEAARIGSRFANWSIKLPRKVADRFEVRLSDIVASTTANEGPSP